jgi:hypothetical protein
LGRRGGRGGVGDDMAALGVDGLRLFGRAAVGLKRVL